jgi:hypothetical protein
VFQHEKAVALPNAPQSIDISRPSEAVYDDDCRRTRGYRTRNGRGIKAVRHRVYVGEDRYCSSQDHSLGDFDVPERRHHDLVAGSDASGPQDSNCPHEGMLTAQRERKMTQNKKELVPQPKSGDQLNQ